jgi:hypothetical protein
MTFLSRNLARRRARHRRLRFCDEIWFLSRSQAVSAVEAKAAGLSTRQPLLLLQLLLLVAYLLLCVAVGPWSDSDAIVAIIAGMFGVAAMAVQNGLAQISLARADFAHRLSLHARALPTAKRCRQRRTICRPNCAGFRTSMRGASR